MNYALYGACIMLTLTSCAAPHTQFVCVDARRIADLPPQLLEASGLAVSRQDPAVLWAHNDSEGAATLYAIDRAGSVLAEIALPEAGPQSDWEDIAAGPCPAGQCLYIGDIGDNRHDRDDRAILRITEPRIDARQPVDVVRYPIRYPDGPVDAEALFVMPDTTLYIVTKGRRHDISLFRYPPPLRPDERVTLERVQQLRDGVAQIPDQVTGADAAPDGQRIAIRTYSSITMYRFDGDTLVGLGPGFPVTSLGEPQGEAVAIAGGDTLLLATETGPARGQPFLSEVNCLVR
ncbi:MAG: hypothetical protein KFH98_16135 [Gemmatimonadetes bacterium]|nr:hypothetical protein [Gemmatimonadota bacterium]